MNSAKIASGAVWVIPWNEPANISVAPNSPSARPQASAKPALMPGAGARDRHPDERPRLADAERPRGVEQIGSTAANAACAWRM